MMELQSEIINNPKRALQHLTNPHYYKNIFPKEIQQLVRIVEAHNSSTYSPSIQICLYCIILHSPLSPPYNHKRAINILSKLYSLSPHRQIISTLLLTIPTFNNHQLIISSITPKYLSNSLLQIHTPAFQQYSLKQFNQKLSQNKCEWNEQPMNKTLSNQFDTLWKLGNKLVNEQNGYQLHLIKQSIYKQYRYIFCKMEKFNQQIEFDKVTDCIDSLLDLKVISTKSSYTLQNQIINSIRMIQNLTLKLLNRLLVLLGKRLLRKIKWLHDLIIGGINNQFKMYLLNYLQLLKTYSCVFGQGSLDSNSILFQNKSSILKIVDSLCKLSFDQPKQQQINFQKNKHHNKGGFSDEAHKVECHLNIIDTKANDYDNYLRNIGKQNRQQILKVSLQIYINYYKDKQIAKNDVSKINELLFIIDNTKNPLNNWNNELYGNLKKIIYKDYIQTKQDYQHFCDHFFRGYISNKMNKYSQKKQLSLQKMNPISLQTFSYRERRQIKRTQSFEVEGWENNVAGNKTDKSKSQMFYSIKECGSQQDDNVVFSQQQGILTPQF